MAKTLKFPISMTNRERTLGFCYAAIDIFLLPALLNALNAQLIRPLSGAWLNFLYFALNFVFLFAIFSRFLKRSLSFTGKHSGDLVVAVIAGFGLYWLSNVLLSFVILQLFPDYANPNDGSIADMASSHFVLMAVGAVLLVPMAEELVHRGLIFGTLAKKSRLAAYIVSTLFFSAIHVAGYIGLFGSTDLILAFVQYLPAGLILGWAYERSGSIFAPMVIHTAVNTMGIYAMR